MKTKLLISILNLPYTKWVGQSIYSIIFKISKKVLEEKNKSLVWARNSYKIGTVVYGKSDIDLTYFTINGPTEAEINRVERKRKLLKKFLFLICEINFYSSKLETSFRLMNRYEAKRDPELLKKIVSYGDGKSDHDIEYLVFLLRQLEADWKNLITRPEDRISKWSHHLGVDPETLSPDKIIQIILDKSHEILINNGLHIEKDLFMTLVYETMSPETNIINFHPLKLFFFPHLWHRFYSWEKFQDNLTYSKNIESGLLLSILAAQIKWELWGELVQIAQEKDRSFLFNAHLSVLNSINKLFLQNSNPDINNALAWINQYYIDHFKEIANNGEHPKIKNSLIP